jgi:trehalose synthase
VLEVPIDPRSVAALASVVGADRIEAVEAELAQAAEEFRGRTVWHVNSTPAGGGVAEMLPRVLAYLNGAGIDTRWLVAEADPAFFGLTKRLHHALHGMAGDGTPLDAARRQHYDRISQANAAKLLSIVIPGDLVVLHDPQVLGLAGPLRAAGVRVVWRCHIGADTTNGHTDAGWQFLVPFLDTIDTAVFSRRAYAPAAVSCPVVVAPPTIDPLSPKNRSLDPDQVVSILAGAGILAGGRHGPAATIVREGPAPAADIPLVVQVSRWDPLKDPCGLIESFADIAAASDAHLVLAGPDVSGVTDDPEGQRTLADCEARWRRLPSTLRRRLHLVSLPMADPARNGLMVNALQRHAAVVVQKSLAEGFGLTVTEAMWKARPTVASAVGGIRDQIVHAEHGLLVDDPTDTTAVAGAVRIVLEDETRAGRLGLQAQRRVRASFLDNRQLSDWAALMVGGSGT